ncbi:MAG: hypothetical protein ACI3XQ_00370 [Eubacteriales bacterium]
MAIITIEELYRGKKYDIMSAVAAKAMTLGIDERTEDGRTWIEMELVRQTIVAMLKLNQNGDCISDKELGDAVAVFDADKLISRTFYADRELGVMAVTVTKRALKSEEGDASILIDSLRPFIPQIDTVSLEIIRDLISKRWLKIGRHDKWLNEGWDELIRVIDRTLSGRKP